MFYKQPTLTGWGDMAYLPEVAASIFGDVFQERRGLVQERLVEIAEKTVTNQFEEKCGSFPGKNT